MSRLQQAKEEIKRIYQDNDIQVIVEVMEIIDKYTSFTGKDAMEASIDELQADAMKLVAYNFHLASLASNMESDGVKAKNATRYQKASKWTKIKEENPKFTQGMVDNTAETLIEKFRFDECEKDRRAKIMRAACESVTEVVNMLKKVVERLMWQGPASNL